MDTAIMLITNNQLEQPLQTNKATSFMKKLHGSKISLKLTPPPKPTTLNKISKPIITESHASGLMVWKIFSPTLQFNKPYTLTKWAQTGQSAMEQLETNTIQMEVSGLTNNSSIQIKPMEANTLLLFIQVILIQLYHMLILNFGSAI